MQASINGLNTNGCTQHFQRAGLGHPLGVGDRRGGWDYGGQERLRRESFVFRIFDGKKA